MTSGANIMTTTTSFIIETERRGTRALPQDFGFWLPYGLGGTPEVFRERDRKNRFRRIERACRAYFDVPDELIALEQDWESYLGTTRPSESTMTWEKHQTVRRSLTRLTESSL